MVDASLFKRYDIRGEVSRALTEDAAEQIGRAFGTYLARAGVIQAVIGHDNRLSSRGLADAAIRGLVAAGCQVTDIGRAATPVVYWCAVETGDVGGLMVTGSHLKPAMNGFKLSIGKRNLYGEQIQALRRMIEAGDFASGQGSARCDDEANARYLAMAESRLHHAGPLTIVVDAGNGMGGVYAVPLLEALGHTVIPLPAALPQSLDHAGAVRVGAVAGELEPAHHIGDLELHPDDPPQHGRHEVLRRLGTGPGASVGICRVRHVGQAVGVERGGDVEAVHRHGGAGLGAEADRVDATVRVAVFARDGARSCGLRRRSHGRHAVAPGPDRGVPVECAGIGEGRPHEDGVVARHRDDRPRNREDRRRDVRHRARS